MVVGVFHLVSSNLVKWDLIMVAIILRSSLLKSGGDREKTIEDHMMATVWGPSCNGLTKELDLQAITGQPERSVEAFSVRYRETWSHHWSEMAFGLCCSGVRSSDFG